VDEDRPTVNPAKQAGRWDRRMWNGLRDRDSIWLAGAPRNPIAFGLYAPSKGEYVSR